MHRFSTRNTLRSLWIAAAALAASPVAFGGDRGPEFPVSIEQARERAEARYREMDADGDGVISASEFQQAPIPAAAWRSHPGHRGFALGKGRPGDGARSRSDGKESKPGPRKPTAAELFARLDSDGDGRLSEQEFSREHIRDAKQSMMRERVFERLDEDGNGALSRDEMPDITARLEAMDADGDGQVTREEARAHREQRRQSRG